MSYHAMILVPPHNTVSLQNIEEKLRTFYTNDQRRIQFSYDRDYAEGALFLKLSVNDWICKIYFLTDDDIIEEAREMAEESAANHPEKNLIASCASRFEIACAPDANMDYFNDYVWVLNVIETFPPVYIWDEAAQNFI